MTQVGLTAEVGPQISDIFPFFKATGQVEAKGSAGIGFIETIAASLDFSNPSQASLASRLAQELVGGQQTNTTADDMRQLYLQGSVRITEAQQTIQSHSQFAPLFGYQGVTFGVDLFDNAVISRDLVQGGSYMKAPGSSQLTPWTSCHP